MIFYGYLIVATQQGMMQLWAVILGTAELVVGSSAAIE